MLIALFIPIYLRNRIATVPELLSRRFSPACGYIYSYTMLFAYVFVFMVPVLYGGSLTFALLTGLNFYIVLWTMVLLVALYTVKGGLLSVMWTDAVQCAMLVGGGLVLYFVALHEVPGGWSAMVAASPERFHLYRPPGDEIAPFAGILLGTFGLFIFYSGTNQVMVQRVLGARSRWDGIMGIIFAGFINLVRPLVTCFLGFIVYHWIHVMHRAEPLEDVDRTFPFVLGTLAPTWGFAWHRLGRLHRRRHVDRKRLGQFDGHHLRVGRLQEGDPPRRRRGPSRDDRPGSLSGLAGNCGPARAFRQPIWRHLSLLPDGHHLCRHPDHCGHTGGGALETGHGPGGRSPHCSWASASRPSSSR